MPSISTLVAASALAATAYGRTITVYNGCPFTIWPALFTSAGTVPSQPTGWEAGAYTAISFTAADDWNGRIWGRRNCDFSSGSTLPSTCATGGCNGGLLCASVGGTGVPPATLAEFNFNGGGSDWYDVSAVDGTDLPMRISNNVGCYQPGCLNDINSICPSELAKYDSNGNVIGCISGCVASSNPSNSPACCSGQYDTPATCPSSGIPYYSQFKAACPDYYFYAYDDATALFTCPSSKKADYTISFCKEA
ncbi:Osmotin thaumatin-like protein [Meredithblackwellia eburnea MCA 4105]